MTPVDSRCKFCGKLIKLNPKGRKQYCNQRCKSYFHTYKDRYPKGFPAGFAEELLTNAGSRGRKRRQNNMVRVQIPVTIMAEGRLAHEANKSDFLRNELKLFLLKSTKEINELILMLSELENGIFKNHTCYITQEMDSKLSKLESDLLRKRRNILIIFSLYCLEQYR